MPWRGRKSSRRAVTLARSPGQRHTAEDGAFARGLTYLRDRWLRRRAAERREQHEEASEEPLPRSCMVQIRDWFARKTQQVADSKILCCIRRRRKKMGSKIHPLQEPSQNPGSSVDPIPATLDENIAGPSHVGLRSTAVDPGIEPIIEESPDTVNTTGLVGPHSAPGTSVDPPAGSNRYGGTSVDPPVISSDVEASVDSTGTEKEAAESILNIAGNNSDVAGPSASLDEDGLYTDTEAGQQLCLPHPDRFVDDVPSPAVLTPRANTESPNFVKNIVRQWVDGVIEAATDILVRNQIGDQVTPECSVDEVQATTDENIAGLSNAELKSTIVSPGTEPIIQESPDTVSTNGFVGPTSAPATSVTPPAGSASNEDNSVDSAVISCDADVAGPSASLGDVRHTDEEAEEQMCVRHTNGLVDLSSPTRTLAPSPKNESPDCVENMVRQWVDDVIDAATDILVRNQIAREQDPAMTCREYETKQPQAEEEALAIECQGVVEHLVERVVSSIVQEPNVEGKGESRNLPCEIDRPEKVEVEQPAPRPFSRHAVTPSVVVPEEDYGQHFPVEPAEDADAGDSSSQTSSTPFEEITSPSDTESSSPTSSSDESVQMARLSSLVELDYKFHSDEDVAMGKVLGNDKRPRVERCRRVCAKGEQYSQAIQRRKRSYRVCECAMTLQIFFDGGNSSNLCNGVDIQGMALEGVCHRMQYMRERSHILQVSRLSSVPHRCITTGRNDPTSDKWKNAIPSERAVDRILGRRKYGKAKYGQKVGPLMVWDDVDNPKKLQRFGLPERKFVHLAKWEGEFVTSTERSNRWNLSLPTINEGKDEENEVPSETKDKSMGDARRYIREVNVTPGGNRRKWAIEGIRGPGRGNPYLGKLACMQDRFAHKNLHYSNPQSDHELLEELARMKLPSSSCCPKPRMKSEEELADECYAKRIIFCNKSVDQGVHTGVKRDPPVGRLVTLSPEQTSSCKESDAVCLNSGEDGKERVDLSKRTARPKTAKRERTKHSPSFDTGMKNGSSELVKKKTAGKNPGRRSSSTDKNAVVPKNGREDHQYKSVPAKPNARGRRNSKEAKSGKKSSKGHSSDNISGNKSDASTSGVKVASCAKPPRPTTANPERQSNHVKPHTPIPRIPKSYNLPSGPAIGQSTTTSEDVKPDNIRVASSTITPTPSGRVKCAQFAEASTAKPTRPGSPVPSRPSASMYRPTFAKSSLAKDPKSAWSAVAKVTRPGTPIPDPDGNQMPLTHKLKIGKSPLTSETKPSRPTTSKPAWSYYPKSPSSTDSESEPPKPTPSKSTWSYHAKCPTPSSSDSSEPSVPTKSKEAWTYHAKRTSPTSSESSIHTESPVQNSDSPNSSNTNKAIPKPKRSSKSPTPSRARSSDAGTSKHRPKSGVDSTQCNPQRRGKKSRSSRTVTIRPKTPKPRTTAPTRPSLKSGDGGNKSGEVGEDAAVGGTKKQTEKKKVKAVRFAEEPIVFSEKFDSESDGSDSEFNYSADFESDSDTDTDCDDFERDDRVLPEKSK